ncbi:hypothetical protein [Variovorax rhizosphaerae]|uniref:Uncharacterized protein n=1 Tax=Variovorax rhizosphaerae TaxID=1836200 RepID=A0ABU8WTK1_9BURK
MPAPAIEQLQRLRTQGRSLHEPGKGLAVRTAQQAQRRQSRNPFPVLALRICEVVGRLARSVEYLRFVLRTPACDRAFAA